MHRLFSWAKLNTLEHELTTRMGYQHATAYYGNAYEVQAQYACCVAHEIYKQQRLWAVFKHSPLVHYRPAA